MTERKTWQKYAVYSAVMELEGMGHGFLITKKAGVSAGTAYGILMAAEKKGDMTSVWEDVDPKEEGRPRRRFYELSASGVKALSELEVHFGGMQHA